MDEMLRQVDGQRLLTEFATWLPRVGAAFLVLVAFLVVYRLSRPALRGTLRRAGLEPHLTHLLVEKLYKTGGAK
jgi:hypothetical protein